MKKTGDVVKSNGREYILGEQLGEGLEGHVFAIVNAPGDTRNLSGHVIKIIDDKKKSEFERNIILKHLKKLKAIRDNKDFELRKYCALPAAILDDDLGYIMTKAENYESLKKYIKCDTPEKFDDWLLKRSIKKRYQIITNIFDALTEIHRAGYVFTDLSPSNILVNKDKNSIVFIDTDNMRVASDPYSGVLGTEGYMAPEIYRYEYTKGVAEKYQSNCGKITRESDIFSAAIIAFLLLTLQHPFIGDVVENASSEVETLALRIETEFNMKPGTKNFSTAWLTPYYHDMITEEISELFLRTFVPGKDNPNLRPTDIEFKEAFKKASDMITTCSSASCKFNFIYSKNKCKCPVCKKPFESKVVFEIYNVYSGCDRAEAINNIGNYPDYDIDLCNLLDENGNKPSNSILISSILLERGEKKGLFMRHFEEKSNRDFAYAIIELSKDEENTVYFSVNPKIYENAMLVNGSTRKMEPLNNGKAFNYTHYGILFETRPFAGNKTIKVFGKFVK